MKKLSILFILFCVLTISASAQRIISIDSVRMNDITTGATMFNGVRVQVSGIVYGPNGYPTPNGDVFMLRNDTMSVKIYSGKTYGYVVNDGDSVVVIGTVSDYHGQTEISPSRTVAGDSIWKVGVGTIQSPVLISQVTGITEVNESELIQVNNVNMGQVSPNWTPSPHASHSFTAHAPYNGTAVNVYIFVDSFLSPDLWNGSAPTGICNIVGFGSQYSTTTPFTGGYSIQPRRRSDFTVVGGLYDITNKLTAITYPNPASTTFNVAFSYEKESSATLKVMDVTGKVMISETKRVEQGENSYQVNTSALANGLYILEVTTGEKSLVTKFNIAN